jgi:hypothetical protein
MNVVVIKWKLWSLREINGFINELGHELEVSTQIKAYELQTQ